MKRWLVALMVGCSTRQVEETKPEPPAPDVCAEKSELSGGGASSTITLARWGSSRVALVADEDDQALRIVDLGTRNETSVTLPGAPGHVLVDPHGRVHVSLPALDQVVSFTAHHQALVECGRTLTSSAPRAMAMYGDELVVLGRDALNVKGQKIALSRDAAGLVIDGGSAVVAHTTGSIVSIVSLDKKVVTREVSFAWRDRVAMGSVIIADMPRFTVQAHGLARIGDRVHVPMVVAYPGDTHLDLKITLAYGASTVRGIDGYFPHEAAIASLRPDGMLPRLRVERESIDVRAQRVSQGRMAPSKPPCLLPSAVAAKGTDLVYTCLGIDKLLMHRTEGALRDSELARIDLPSGPTGLAIDGDEAVVWSQFARAVTVVSLPQGTPVSIPIAPAKTVAWADGRKIFHTPLGFDGRACASCHPDGHDDGLVWTSPHGPMQAPMLAGRLTTTAPFGWLGMAPDLSAHLTETMKRIGAKPMDKVTMDALITYVTSLEAPPKKELDARARRGRDLFKSTEVGCASCHQDGGSDGMKHDVGTGGMFDTPSLASIGMTGPYMHDGRFTTLREAITLDSMGNTKNLSEDDLAALVAYLKTL